jgi:hypothetical protein
VGIHLPPSQWHLLLALLLCDVGGFENLCFSIACEVCDDDVVFGSTWVIHDVVDLSRECSDGTAFGLLGVVMNGTTSCTILLVIDLHCS